MLYYSVDYADLNSATSFASRDRIKDWYGSRLSEANLSWSGFVSAANAKLTAAGLSSDNLFNNSGWGTGAIPWTRVIDGVISSSRGTFFRDHCFTNILINQILAACKVLQDNLCFFMYYYADNPLASSSINTFRSLSLNVTGMEIRTGEAADFGNCSTIKSLYDADYAAATWDAPGSGTFSPGARVGHNPFQNGLKYNWLGERRRGTYSFDNLPTGADTDVKIATVPSDHYTDALSTGAFTDIDGEGITDLSVENYSEHVGNTLATRTIGPLGDYSSAPDVAGGITCSTTAGNRTYSHLATALIRRRLPDPT